MSAYAFRSVLYADKSADGLSYDVQMPDGTTRKVPALVFEALFTSFNDQPIPQPAALPVPNEAVAEHAAAIEWARTSGTTSNHEGTESGGFRAQPL